MKQMSEDNQQLNYLKKKVDRTEQHSKAVKETLSVITQKLSETMEENIFIRSKAKEKHLEDEQEVIYLFFPPKSFCVNNFSNKWCSTPLEIF